MEIIMGIKRIAALTMALTVSVSAMFSEVYAEENTVLDEKVIEQIYDENNDNTKDIKDLAMAANLSLDLKDIDDISFLKYAVSCKYLHLSNSTLTDFSVIKEMKNLVYVSMNNISPANLSFLENAHIKRCSLGGADISDEEKLRYVHAEDYIIPEGQLSSIGMYPAGLFEGEIIIKDTDIIGFGEYGDSENSTGMEGIVSAKKQGETEYSLVVDGKNLKTGRIKVIPQEIQDFPLEENIIKTEEITKERLGLHKNKKLLLIVAGSLGSESINNIFLKFLSKVNENDNFEVLYITGKNYYDDFINGKTFSKNIKILYRREL